MKQYIVMRADLRNTEGHKVRTGKLIAQGAHASLGVVATYGLNEPRIKEWLAGSFTKICLKVDSEKELLDMYFRAIEAGLLTRLIIDNGRTEFSGPTVTCCAIGPDTEENLAMITGGLKLF